MISLSARLGHLILKRNQSKDHFRNLTTLVDDPVAFLEQVREYREIEDCLKPEIPASKKISIEQNEVDGCPLYYLRAKEPSDKVIFYIHGGSYFQGPFQIHWDNFSWFSAATGATIAVLNYPKTPEASCLEILSVVEKTWVQIQRDFPEQEIILMGDSAGGGICLSLFQILRDKKSRLPDKLILLSPWLDVAMSHPESPRYNQTDLMMTISGLRACGRYYAGNCNLNDPLVSPKYGNYDKLPETHLFIGGAELFRPDGIDFAQRLKKEGRSITLHFAEGMQHIWPLFPVLKESREARRVIFGIINGD